MNLPDIIAVHTSDPALVRIDLNVPADHPAFAGHYPIRPILPGVVQIDWVVRLADLHLATKLAAATDFQVKFRRTISADEPISLELRLDPGKGVLSFTYRLKGDIASSGRIKLRELE